MEQHMIEFSAIEIGRYISKGSDGVIFDVKIDGVFGKYVVKQFHNRQKYDEGKIKWMLQLKHPNVIELQ